MTDTYELDRLVQQARALGATVVVTYELNDEGRRLYESVTVRNLRGIGPYPMSPLSAAETLRRANHEALHYNSPEQVRLRRMGLAQ